LNPTAFYQYYLAKMSGNKRCTECQSTESTKFRSLNGEKWREVESKGLVKVM